jgi:hypothetical protein
VARRELAENAQESAADEPRLAAVKLFPTYLASGHNGTTTSGLHVVPYRHGAPALSI